MDLDGFVSLAFASKNGRFYQILLAWTARSSTPSASVSRSSSTSTSSATGGGRTSKKGRCYQVRASSSCFQGQYAHNRVNLVHCTVLHSLHYTARCYRCCLAWTTRSSTPSASVLRPSSTSTRLTTGRLFSRGMGGWEGVRW